MGMATKNISITEEAYKRLQGLKKENESFSKTIERLSRKKSLSKFAGILSDETAQEIKRGIKEDRKAQNKLYEKKHKETVRKFG